jgi:2-polyprenyl-6-hydroxyphenyl methylase/3-demethylubiquinone-9 3-methyltransferase
VEGGLVILRTAVLGCNVAGVEPSPVSIEAARNHAATRGLDIDYRVGSGEQLPAGDSTFDLVYCCDVLEHVSDLDRVVRETARVLKPGGLYLALGTNHLRRTQPATGRRPGKEHSRLVHGVRH